jgi:hypothetical protein
MYKVIAFAATCIVAVISGVILSRKTQGITFIGANSDNEKQARAASFIGQWRWPSDMHKYGGGKTRTKDVFVLGLVVLRRLLGDNAGGDPTVRLCILVNSISAVLIFLVAKTYWDIATGLLVFALFITSFWPYLVVLFGGHICVAQMFFLASVYLMQLAELRLWPSDLVSYFVSGLAIGLMMFSSASSRKYLPLLGGAFFYSQREALVIVGEGVPADLLRIEGVRLAVASSAIAFLLAVGLIALTYRRVVTAMYSGRAPAWLNQLIAGRDRLGLEYYLVRASKIVQLLAKFSFVIVLYLGVCLALFRSPYFYYSQFLVLLGTFLVFVLFTYPDIIQNLEGYFYYWNAPKQHGHYRLYKRHFESIAKPIGDKLRGSGVRWVIRFLLRIAPFHLAYYVLSGGLIGYLLFRTGLQQTDVWKSAGMLFLSLSPVLVGEMTRGPQVGRSYYPAFAGLLLMMGYAVSWMGESLSAEGRAIFLALTGGAVLAGVAWNMRVFLDDVLPARMAPAWLARTLMAKGIKEFYTYDTHYNDALVKIMPKRALDRVEIRFINSLRDVKEGYIVVPGTSAKAFNMESQQEAIEQGDFNKDPILTQLIESKEIERYALTSFKTFGTSRVWIQESDVGSYRDLIVGEIGESDRWRGRAWILDAAKLHAEGRSGHAIENLLKPSAITGDAEVIRA